MEHLTIASKKPSILTIYLSIYGEKMYKRLLDIADIYFVFKVKIKYVFHVSNEVVLVRR